MPCPKHGLTLTITIEANAMSQTWSYTSSHISVLMPCPRHGLTLTHISRLMPCPRHGLTLALIMWPMHGPDMFYTSTHITQMSWHEYPIYCYGSTGSLSH
ncbi:hypothetical protein F383_34344 [Gossypium arboreum]|uniref:Uncharacterized protein n=1 Tax=Gossypium arboreum TaxID=29729 RepID=A0A0B0N655_GOSAR|nr:hypothetical protein F383_34344 [Gossypium arboreum]